MEKRKIRLKAGEPAQTHWFNGAVEAKPGKTIEVRESQGRMAVETGRFEYVGIDTPDVVNPNDLPEDFPFRTELAGIGLHTLSDLNGADNEAIKGAKNVSDGNLKKIRAAAEKLGEQTNE